MNTVFQEQFAFMYLLSLFRDLLFFSQVKSLFWQFEYTLQFISYLHLKVKHKQAENIQGSDNLNKIE